MNNKPNCKKGTRLTIIKLMHLCGIVPCRSLELFDNAVIISKSEIDGGGDIINEALKTKTSNILK